MRATSRPSLSSRARKTSPIAPAPIFASLATATLLGDGGKLAGAPVLGAALGALVLSRTRSLLLCLLGGAAGYVVGLLLR